MKNSYTFKGGTVETYAPHFTWFVFKDVELIGWPGELTLDCVQAEAVYTGVETTGLFTCSKALFEKIDRLYWRSQTDNLHGALSSDCPHRERLGYTGDGQASCVTESGKPRALADGITGVVNVNGDLALDAASGSYAFTVRHNAL